MKTIRMQSTSGTTVFINPEHVMTIHAKEVGLYPSTQIIMTTGLRVNVVGRSDNIEYSLRNS